MPGFIHDKLEIKFLILYIAARVSEPLPLEGMQELTMCDDGIDYLHSPSVWPIWSRPSTCA